MVVEGVVHLELAQAERHLAHHAHVAHHDAHDALHEGAQQRGLEIQKHCFNIRLFFEKKLESWGYRNSFMGSRVL